MLKDSLALLRLSGTKGESNKDCGHTRMRLMEKLLLRAKNGCLVPCEQLRIINRPVMVYLFPPPVNLLEHATGTYGELHFVLLKAEISTLPDDFISLNCSASAIGFLWFQRAGNSSLTMSLSDMVECSINQPFLK